MKLLERRFTPKNRQKRRCPHPYFVAIEFLATAKVQKVAKFGQVFFCCAGVGLLASYAHSPTLFLVPPPRRARAGKLGCVRQCHERKLTRGGGGRRRVVRRHPGCELDPPVVVASKKLQHVPQGKRMPGGGGVATGTGAQSSVSHVDRCGCGCGCRIPVCLQPMSWSSRRARSGRCR